ncbi:Hypothetical predicted protein [Pelobates cultripes]|uniref:Uncharacterized protein n=1 Tax=Pelobates cultripes TaxID=61616 RepID=A0AAD1T7G4_PELCU|nr:Hypothetical predicted protein [Pelobates cultripes]
MHDTPPLHAPIRFRSVSPFPFIHVSSHSPPCPLPLPSMPPLLSSMSSYPFHPYSSSLHVPIPLPSMPSLLSSMSSYPFHPYPSPLHVPLALPSMRPLLPSMPSSLHVPPLLHSSFPPHVHTIPTIDFCAPDENRFRQWFVHFLNVSKMFVGTGANRLNPTIG